jgi:hypothetical protein
VTFKAHKLILAACSKHLADLFETSPPHQNLIIILDGTSAANMSALLEFMYKGEVPRLPGLSLEFSQGCRMSTGSCSRRKLRQAEKGAGLEVA